jgi:large subunit ribosomal protein L4
LPKKMRRGALRSALSARFQEGNLKLIDTLPWARPHTRDGLNLLERLSCPQRTLVVLDEWRPEVFRTFSNIPGVSCVAAAALTPYEVLCHQGLLMTEAAVAALERRLGDG